VFTTKQELAKLRQHFDKKYDQLDKTLLATRWEMEARFEKVDEKLAEQNDKMLTMHSEVMGELKAIREEQTDISKLRSST